MRLLGYILIQCDLCPNKTKCGYTEKEMRDLLQGIGSQDDEDWQV